ncbi:hypothetical protein E3N88_45256 [Mikania micrantha]|uniref:Uncharacterized protein n=1 Tax=Mikania micrantha TaxID=192012 RepID=A0A5N6L9S1_9ASTR|nr:hypothetical protein E3N88_45259 [Mikania micrantha]KAC9787241.1 hypothetical protein E3N88_45256 [Mikania micrantha]
MSLVTTLISQLDKQTPLLIQQQQTNSPSPVSGFAKIATPDVVILFIQAQWSILLNIIKDASLTDLKDGWSWLANKSCLFSTKSMRRILEKQIGQNYGGFNDGNSWIPGKTTPSPAAGCRPAAAPSASSSWLAPDLLRSALDSCPLLLSI